MSRKENSFWKIVKCSNKVLIFFSGMTTRELVLEMTNIKLLKILHVFLCTSAYVSALNTISSE